MTDNKEQLAREVAEYRRRSALRRESSSLKSTVSTALDDGVTVVGGVVIVEPSRSRKSSKTVAESGGPSKVFGQSKIFIPEFRKSAQRK